MSLSKQLYIIISFIFFIIFMGNFVISVKNTKEYLQTESTTKAQDTATSLGMTLKSFMNDKSDPEIKSVINAIANRGFYKEIRLENVVIDFSSDDLIEKSNLPKKDYEIFDVAIDSKYGKIETVNSDNAIANELAMLENEAVTNFENSRSKVKKFVFKPSNSFQNGDQLVVEFKAKIDNKVFNSHAVLYLSKVIAQVSRKEKFDYVPQWFIDMIPLKMEETKSQISNGWNTTAIIYVSANAGDAYAKLYEQAKGAILYAIISFIVSIIFLVIFLRFILKPLKNIEILAKSISNGKFETIKELPWTTELRNVSVTMNDMSTKIEGVIHKLNNNLETMTKKLSQDELTKLQLKNVFLTDLKVMFLSKEKGYIFLVKLDNLSEYAKSHTKKEVDAFLVKFSDILKNISKDVSAYRFFGSEFALIIKCVDKDKIDTIIKTLKEKFEQLSVEISKKEIVHIGGTTFDPLGTTDAILSTANEAYEKAKLIGPNETFIEKNSSSSRDMNEWKRLVDDIINNGKFSIKYVGQSFGLHSQNQNKLLMEEAFTNATDENGKSIPIGTFISIAEQFNMISSFDKQVVLKVIEHIKSAKITHKIMVNLSLDSVFDIKFKNWLKDTIVQNSDIGSQLVFSVTAYGVAKNSEKFKYFIESIHHAGGKVIIKRFETKFISLDDIKTFNLDYIRLARDYTDGISTDSSKQSFVESMQELANLLSIQVFAENVKDDNDFEKVKELGIYGASR